MVGVIGNSSVVKSQISIFQRPWHRILHVYKSISFAASVYIIQFDTLRQNIHAYLMVIKAGDRLRNCSVADKVGHYGPIGRAFVVDIEASLIFLLADCCPFRKTSGCLEISQYTIEFIKQLLISLAPHNP